MSYIILGITYFFTSLLYILWPVALLVMLTKVSKFKIALPITIVIYVSAFLLGYQAFLLAGAIVFLISILFYLIGDYVIW